MNHQKDAAKIIEQVENYGEVGSESDLNVSIAQTHAILAVAEQLRVGNLISVGQLAQSAGVGDSGFIEDAGTDAFDRMTMGDFWQALGIEQP